MVRITKITNFIVKSQMKSHWQNYKMLLPNDLGYLLIGVFVSAVGKRRVKCVRITLPAHKIKAGTEPALNEGIRVRCRIFPRASECGRGRGSGNERGRG